MKQRCNHRPGTIVDIDPDVIWSTCTAGCDRPIWKLYDPGSEDRAGRGWPAWRPAPSSIEVATGS